MSFEDFCEAGIKIITVAAAAIAVGAGICSSFDKKKKKKKTEEQEAAEKTETVKNESGFTNPYTQEEARKAKANMSGEKEDLTRSEKIVRSFSKAGRNCEKVSRIVNGLATLASSVGSLGDDDDDYYQQYPQNMGYSRIRMVGGQGLDYRYYNGGWGNNYPGY